MRQKFNIGDFIEVDHPFKPNARKQGIVVETQVINNHLLDKQSYWHPDEYRCRVVFLGSDEAEWVRAKWLTHVAEKQNSS
jgi:hypothetical protein